MPEKTETIQFTKERETKNKAVFEEIPGTGKPKIVGSLYVEKWFAGAANNLKLTVAIS